MLIESTSLACARLLVIANQQNKQASKEKTRVRKAVGGGGGGEKGGACKHLFKYPSPPTAPPISTNCRVDISNCVV